MLHLRLVGRLSSAWTATDKCAATPAAGASGTVGGPNPYWQSWTYTADGLRSTQTDHDTAGNTADDTTTTYHYPAAGSATDQPHTLTSTTATGPGAAAETATDTYDAAGNTLSISASPAGAQNLVWNDQGKLASDTTSAGTTSYFYDATERSSCAPTPARPRCSPATPRSSRTPPPTPSPAPGTTPSAATPSPNAAAPATSST